MLSRSIFALKSKLMMPKRILLFLILCTTISGLRAQPLKSDSVEVIHYDLSFDLVHLSSKQLQAKATISFKALLPGMNAFNLDLLRLNVDSIKTGNQSCSFLYNDTILRIHWPQTLPAGDTLEVSIWYHGQPNVEAYGWGGFHFASDSSLAYNLGIAFYDKPHNYGRVWFPCIDEFPSRSSFDFHIRVKNPMKAVCSGYLVSVDAHPDNSSTYHWKLEQKIPAYLASVAVSNFAIPSFSLNGMLGSIPADIYVKPADSANALASMASLPDMLNIFESRFGPYRWPRIGYVATTLGAMEHACNIATPSYMFNGTTSYEWLFAHELAHAWFGNLVTCATAEDMWLNEGWAVFCESIFTEGKYGVQASKDYVRANHEQVLQYAHTSQGDGSYLPLYGIPHNYTYGTTVYDKGASVVHSLRGYLGDSLFFAAIKAYLNQFAFSHASSNDLRDFLSTYTGINMSPWFDAWVFTPGFIDFRVDSMHCSSQGSPYSCRVYLSQQLKGPAQPASNHRTQLRFMNQDWDTHTVLALMDGASDSLDFLLPFKPEFVMIDPEEKIMDATTDCYQVLKTIGSYTFLNTKCTLNVQQISDSAFVRITHHWVAPDAFSQPIPGLTLSKSRYWTVEGIFPAGFSAEGRFQYSRSNFLDDDILVSTLDSLIILYRKGPGYEWESIAFQRVGAAFNGRISVPNLKPGDYALAVWDKSHLGVSEEIPGNGAGVLAVYPNPGIDSFTIYTAKEGFLIISNVRGITVHQQWMSEGQELSWQARKPGSYTAILMTREGLLEARIKFIAVR
jgi:hypothetical protein